MKVKRSKDGSIKMTAENKHDSLDLLKFLERAAGRGDDPNRMSLVRERRLAIEEQYKGIFTQNLWDWSTALPKLLNLLLQNEECIKSFDMYGSGEFLSMEVFLDKSREHLKLVIKKIKEYLKLNNDQFNHDADPNVVGLSKLVQIHREYFGSDKAIMWNANSREFISAEEFAVINEFGPFANDKEVQS